ncbi:MAG: glycosyltransferase family 2 protein [Planctomycetes bacterium]|nr:glycosyltransferase family 2 protein [Planctomycetota bacterium]
MFSDSWTAMVFWLSLFLILHSYVFYPVVLWIIASIRPYNARTDEMHRPRVSCIIPAYNEASVIEAKIRNTLSLDYPAGLLEIVVGSDGSTDDTVDVVKKIQAETKGIRLFDFEKRRGKIATVNDLVSRVTDEILVLTDANCFINPSALLKIVRHFADPKVGVVAGKKTIADKGAGDHIGRNEGLYWRYESFIKSNESRVHSVVGADGAIYAVRRSLYRAPPEDTLVDDFLLSMKILEGGHRIVFEPEAASVEEAMADEKEEYARKIRISSGAFQSIPRLWRLLNPLMGYPFFFYMSHKLLRWFTPFLLIVMLIANTVLLFSGPAFFKITLAGQAAFYLSVFAGWRLAGSGRSNKVFHFVYYFTLTNIAQIHGLINWLGNRQKATWDKVNR